MKFKSIGLATEQSFVSWVYNFSHEENALSMLIHNKQQKWTAEFNNRRKRMGKKICASDCCSLCVVLMTLHGLLWAAYNEIHQELLYVESVVWNDSN